jgi:hypothetical protein
VDSKLLLDARELLNKELMLKAGDILKSKELLYSICVLGDVVLLDTRELLDKELMLKIGDLLESKELLYSICVLGDIVLLNVEAILSNELIVLVLRDKLSISKVDCFVLLHIGAVMPLK